MYSKKTRVHCYAFTLLPALIGLVLWSTNPQTVFPLAVLFTPVLLALTLALCLHLTEKLEKDREKNKKSTALSSGSFPYCPMSPSGFPMPLRCSAWKCPFCAS